MRVTTRLFGPFAVVKLSVPVLFLLSVNIMKDSVSPARACDCALTETCPFMLPHIPDKPSTFCTIPISAGIGPPLTPIPGELVAATKSLIQWGIVMHVFIKTTEKAPNYLGYHEFRTCTPRQSNVELSSLVCRERGDRPRFERILEPSGILNMLRLSYLSLRTVMVSGTCNAFDFGVSTRYHRR
ncbi:hypothetical protein EX30DRAFT_260446 [Ascodesmis nigricans]|uniref:Uncharacterized protein n=1 Tax=Ascodesmis nigricans TaxID=341454 RepID=A0A4S2MXQ4_9PEZI|nr:hypothetical protein EX30DRAFT_260446 [Ascodesmis nigricans]